MVISTMPRYKSPENYFIYMLPQILFHKRDAEMLKVKSQYFQKKAKHMENMTSSHENKITSEQNLKNY